jgi:ribulose kinase
MQPPKLRWLKTHLPGTWARARRLFDLADYLVYEVCREDVRSFCTVVCKWT